MKKECSELLRTLHNEMKKNFGKNFRDDTEQLNITPAQSMLLRYLMHRKGKAEINQRKIENMTGLSNPTVSGILKRMEEKELIIRTVNKKDARNKTIELAPKAFEVEKNICQSWKGIEEKLVKGLSTEEQEEFKKIVEIMIKNMQEDTE